MRLRSRDPKPIPVYKDDEVLARRKKRLERERFDVLDYFEGYCQLCGCTVFLPYSDIHRTKCPI